MHLFVEQLTNVDFSYLDLSRGIVGETWWASAILEGALDEQGMVCDFGTVKKVLRNWMDDEIDHRLLVPELAEGLTITQSADRIELRCDTARGPITMNAPREAVTLIDAKEITIQSVASWCIRQLEPHFPNSIDQLSLDFTPEEINGAMYHYSHGLKKHDGNCQRIAHGHRSRIQIWLDGNRNQDEEAYWADLWKDIYIGSKEDLIDSPEDEYQFEYTAQQGEFYLSLSKQHCYLIDTDTTVELIANHLANKIKARHPNTQVTVRAFEGVNKGAMVTL
ncbi:MAG: 6-pyruvoyl-tetrahydropterin synthase [Thalassolituus sp.]|jgi:6-pyruvoyl-tetrahydropterin synthase|tara:strand:+ start:915 stop:1748 length:834 start_codon:yes stop_codon:yes gene_type:complete